MEKPAHEELRIEKIIKRKTDKLFLKSKRYGDSFNSSIDKKDLLKKFVNTLLNHLEVWEEIVVLKLISPIMQQEQMWKVYHTLILQVLH